MTLRDVSLIYHALGPTEKTYVDLSAVNSKQRRGRRGLRWHVFSEQRGDLERQWETLVTGLSAQSRRGWKICAGQEFNICPKLPKVVGLKLGVYRQHQCCLWCGGRGGIYNPELRMEPVWNPLDLFTYPCGKEPVKSIWRQNWTNHMSITICLSILDQSDLSLPAWGFLLVQGATLTAPCLAAMLFYFYPLMWNWRAVLIKLPL